MRCASTAHLEVSWTLAAARGSLHCGCPWGWESCLLPGAPLLCSWMKILLAVCFLRIVWRSQQCYQTFGWYSSWCRLVYAPSSLNMITWWHLMILINSFFCDHIHIGSVLQWYVKRGRIVWRIRSYYKEDLNNWWWTFCVIVNACRRIVCKLS